MPPNPGAPLIVHVVYGFAVGGLENGVCNLINRLPHDRWRHAIVALTDVSPEFCARLERRDVPIETLRKPPGHGVRLYPRLYRLFRAMRPAIVHTRNLAALEAVVPAWAAGVPARVHGEHGRDMSDLDGASARYRWLRRLYSPFVSRYVVLSRDLGRYLSAGVGIGAARIEHICNGVDAGRFHPAVRGPRTPVDLPFGGRDLCVVGTVGRMQPVKGQVGLARAFVHALEIDPAARERLRLVLVGEGPLRSECAAILARAGVGHLAWMPGERADVPDILRGLDCFVLPSLAEGISNTVLEAMACARPVIATRVGGNAELVEPEVTGRLVPARDDAALARAMLGYLHDPGLARRHGAAGRQRVEREFSLDRMVASYQSLYDAVLATRDGRPAPAASA